MNFVDPKEYEIPGLVRKNRYKTILPSEYLLPSGVGRKRGPVIREVVKSRTHGDDEWSSQEMGWRLGQPGKGRVSRDRFTFCPWTLTIGHNCISSYQKGGSDTVQYARGLSILGEYIIF